MTTFDYVLMWGVAVTLFVGGLTLIVRAAGLKVSAAVCRVKGHDYSGWLVQHELVSVMGSAADGLLLQFPRSVRPACRRCKALRPGGVGVDLRQVHIASYNAPAVHESDQDPHQ